MPATPMTRKVSTIPETVPSKPRRGATAARTSMVTHVLIQGEYLPMHRRFPHNAIALRIEPAIFEKVGEGFPFGVPDH